MASDKVYVFQGSQLFQQGWLRRDHNGDVVLRCCEENNKNDDDKSQTDDCCVFENENIVCVSIFEFCYSKLSATCWNNLNN